MSLAPDSRQPYPSVSPWLDLTSYVVNGWSANNAWPFLAKIEGNTVQLFLSTRMGTDHVVAEGLPAEVLPPRTIYLLGYQRGGGAMQLGLSTEGVLEIAVWESPRLDGATATQLSLSAVYMRRGPA